MSKYRHKLLGHKINTETRLVVSAMGIYRFTHSKVLSIHISLVTQAVLYCGCIIHSQYLLPSTITNGNNYEIINMTFCRTLDKVSQFIINPPPTNSINK